ncbi:MAG: protein kinase [Thermoguttaceae bacterium]|jgi:serine/threonine-protein kinase
MVATNSQCDRRQLRELLEDKLPPKSQEDLARHLESCPDCRKELESLAAGPEWWSDAQQLLSTIVNLNDATSADNVLKPRGMVSHADGLRLEFLSPSDDPTKLGRLGPYEIVKVIGRGGMGIVLKGFDSVLNRYVAIKVLAPQWMHSTAARQRFAREARAAAAVVHEHVIAIYAVDSANKTPYLVMPFIDGISLQERIDRASATSATGYTSANESATGYASANATGYASVNGPLELKEILRIGIQIAAGLTAAHAQGLVHRDIKPANILLENGVERVLITDFGLARAVDDASFTRSCFIAGTPEYMAPEQANGEAVDHRIDLFSLGSVMYAMCTGRSPFRRETTMAVLRQICEGTPRAIREINPKIPKWLERIIASLHAKNPAERFQTAGEVAELLGRWLAHIEQPSLYPKPREPAGRWRAFAWFSRRGVRHRWAAAAALLLMLVGITATEITGVSHLSRWFFGVEEARSPVSPSIAAAPHVKAALAKGNASELPADKETAFDKWIVDLWRRIAALETSPSAGETSDAAPERIGQFRTELANLQAELPEYRQDRQIERLRQVGAAIEQLKPQTSLPEAGQGIDSSMIEINERIEQLNQDLYRNFP